MDWAVIAAQYAAKKQREAVIGTATTHVYNWK